MKGVRTMKERLRITISALIWAVVLLSAYALTAPAQTRITNNQQTDVKQARPVQAASSTLPVAGSGTVGQLTKWTGLTSSSALVGDSVITEDKLGNIGIG